MLGRTAGVLSTVVLKASFLIFHAPWPNGWWSIHMAQVCRMCLCLRVRVRAVALTHVISSHDRDKASQPLPPVFPWLRRKLKLRGIFSRKSFTSASSLARRHPHHHTRQHGTRAPVGDKNKNNAEPRVTASCCIESRLTASCCTSMAAPCLLSNR